MHSSITYSFSSSSKKNAPSMLIDFDNDTFASIKKKMKHYKQKHGFNA